MKCYHCGHESKEEHPKFCCECGKSLGTSLPVSVNQENNNAKIASESGDYTPAFLNELEPGKELIADITKTSNASDQLKISEDEPQSLKDTGPPVKKRKKRNRKKSKKKKDSDSAFISLPANFEHSTIVESDNDDECGSLTDLVTVESIQPTALTIGNADATNTPVKADDGETVPIDSENPSSGQENAVLIHNKDVSPNQDEHKKEAKDGMPKVSNRGELLVSSKKDPQSMVTSSADLEDKSVSEKEASKEKKIIAVQVKELKIPESNIDISTDTKLKRVKLGNEHESQNVKKKEWSQNIQSSSKNDTINTGMQNTGKSRIKPDTNQQIQKSASSERVLEVESEAENTKNKVTAAHKCNKDKKVDAITKVSTDEEKNNNCGHVTKDNENTSGDKMCETKLTTKPQNKKEAEESTKDSLPDTSNTLIQKNTIKNENGKGPKNKNEKEAPKNGDAKQNNKDAKKDNTPELLQGGAGQNDTKVDAIMKVSAKKKGKHSCADKDNEDTSDDKICENKPTTRPQNKTDSEIKMNESTNACPPDSVNRLIQKDTNKEGEKGSKNKTNKEQVKGNSKNNNDNVKKGKAAANQQSEAVKSSSKEKADIKEEQEASKRELHPDNCITLYFHVIVSKYFGVKVNEDKVVVKGGKIKGYREWKDDLCVMNYSKEIKDHGFLYEGQTQISKEILDRDVPYKYVIVRANGNEDYEFIYNVDAFISSPMNRCLYIQSKYIHRREWHQYDDVCMIENPGMLYTLRNLLKNRYEVILKGRIVAGEVMLSSIFSILSNIDHINLSNFFIQLRQFYAVYVNPILIGDRKMSWKSLDFGVNQVHNLIFKSLSRVCEPFLGQRTLQEDDIKDKLIAGLICVMVVNMFEMNVQKNMLANICSILCLDNMPRENMILELQRAKTTFCKIPGMDNNLRTLCQKCIDDSINEWVWVLPVFHAFTASSNPDASNKAARDKQEDVWAGLEGLAYHKVKKCDSDILKKMISKQYLMQADLALIESWLCLIPITYMAEFLEKMPVKIVSALKACYFKFPGAEFDHREKIKPILKKLIQLMEKQGKPPNADAFQVCCKASLDLHKCICCDLFLKRRHELPALSAEILLTLLRISDLSHQCKEEASESNSQEPVLEKILEDALLLTNKWLEDIFGHRFNLYEHGNFSSELWVWNQILKVGENVTPKWKDSLLCVLLRKIKREDAVCQITLYCKEQYQFKDLHPSINKCFEDCAIEAVHMACQSETNILSQLGLHNLGNFGRLVSSVIENSWPKDNQGKHVKDSDGILQHLLSWPDATYIFKLYGTDSSIISQFGEDIQELVALSESVFLEVVRNVMDGEVLFKHMESILKHREQFVAICKLKTEKKEKLSLNEINRVLGLRKDELYTLHLEREWVDSLLKMIQSVYQHIKVNVCEILSKHSQDLGPQKLMDMLPVSTLNSSNKCTKLGTYYNLSADSMSMARHLNDFKISHVFTTCWEREARALADRFVADSEFTVEEINEELFNPCFENCKKIYNDIKSGKVTFEVVDEFLKDFKDRYQELEKELKLLCPLGGKSDGKWISDRVKQIEQYHQLDVAFRSAKVIFDLKRFLKLNGDFQTLETLLQFADNFEHFKQNPLSCISEEVVNTKKLLSEMNENHTACLMEALKRKEFFLWVQEALEDVNELKVFVDLASISAGENDMDVDRVACFHDAVLGYAPLLYDLKPEFGFDDFMKCLKKLWKALKSDPKLPEKFTDSARHIEWLKTVKESHGSVELSSLSLATTINKRGIYIIKAPKDNKKITPDSVLQLVLMENEENKRSYTLEELKELLNKLMLMSGKGEQGNSEVDKFSEIFSNVQRLAGSFIDLYLAGNMLFRTWEAQIHCEDNANVSVFMDFNIEEIDELQGQGALTDLLPDICKTMEKLLDEWLAFVNKKRSQLYYLNYYTAEQVVYLCQQYQMRDISEEALVMLSFIKPHCKKIDTINSFCFPKTSSCFLTTANQPDMMNFAMELKNCTDVSKKLELVWMFSMDNMSSFFPGCLDLDTLGTSLAALAELNKKPVNRNLHPSLHPGRPNLILCPPSEMLSCAIAIYMHSSGEQLPSYDEVLLCTHYTTYEEVALFLRRCLTPGYSGKKIYSLIYADQLSYDVGYKSELLFQQLQAQGMDKYNLVIICNSDREHCYIPSVFSQFKIHMIPQGQPLEIHRYLCTHFKVGSDVVSAASVFKDGMSVGIVSSKRAGVGKSLYVKRLYRKLARFSSEKPLLKIIRLIKPEVDENKVLDLLLPFLDGKLKSCPIIFHIDITSSVNGGISEFLFKLLILQYLMDSQGRIWKRQPSHLYIIEILESSDIFKQFKSVPRIVQNGFIDFFPKISCCSPKEVLTKTTQTDKTIYEVPGMDIKEFRSECFQRPYQYLTRFDMGQNLDTFVYIEGQTEGDPAKCLQMFLLYCGIVDPSWSELRNFAWFLNLQLRDCEASVFCKHELVGDTLQGFKNFVVEFMILMAKDFATPSLHIADQSPGRFGINLDGVKEQDLAPFLLRKKWESEPHPYIFFNEDHASMTFIGFHLQPNNAGGVDAINPRNESIIRKNVMSLQLYEGLKLQRVPFNTDFDQLPRHEKISRLCMVLGIQWPMDPDETYELTMDNILKILAIKMRFRCGIPVVIMGETGCGKTRLIKFLCHLCKGFVETENMKLVKVHGGTTAETIYQKILEAQETAQINKAEGCETVLFFDEANTTEAISSIKEALCDHTVEGVPLQEGSGLHIIAACNPYRKHTDDMIKRLESAGLGYKVRADETKERLGSIPLRQLVYRVHALPPSMMPLVWDFGQLNNETEKKYIQQIVLRLAKEIQLSATDIQLLTDVLSASQSYMRKKNDECSFVSLRDVERCIEVFKWFFNRHEKLLKLCLSLAQEKEERKKEERKGRKSTSSMVDKAAWSLVHAVGVCYHASLETKDSYRRAVCKFFPLPYRDPTYSFQEITSIQDLFLAGVQLRDTIARNLALKENLFMMVICIELKIPLFLVGKPGSSKSLAKTIVADAMQGQAAHTELYKDLKQIHLVSFQCSPHSTPEGIIGTFRHCARFQEGKNLNEYVSVVVLDEIGLAEDSPKMPLKTLHPLLEDGCIDDDTSPHKKVGFIGISNWALDPAKMNRGIFVSRGDPNRKELIESAKGICSSDNLVLRKVLQYFPSFSEAYLEVCKTLKEQEKEFFGLRDFYSLIKMVFAFTKESQDILTLDEIARAVLRNFSGKDEVNALDIFLRDKRKNIADINTIDLIMENIRSDSDDCRYLLILTKNYAALQILQQAFLKENQQPEIIFGSSFPKDQEYTQICRNINRVKICMETGQMVILLNLQNLYESLYDALNQYYVYLAGQKYVDLGLGTHRVKCRVHPKFKLIVIEEKEIVYKDFPIPLINRLEKHYLDINTFLKKEHKVIVQELEGWVEDFTKDNQDHIIGKAQTYRPSDVFIGYHSDTCASVVLQVTENMKQSHTDTENKTDVRNQAEQVLLNCATPDSVIRLGRKELIDEYFKKQKHGSLLDFLYSHVSTGYNNNHHTTFTEITTFSRLLTSADRKVLETELKNHIDNIEILSLQQFDTEFSFLKKIRSFLESPSRNLILIIQTDFEEGSQGANLVASAKYSAVNEIQKVNLTAMCVFVYFITKLPRMQGGTSYVGFRGGLWQSIHIDDLRKSKDIVDDVTALQNLTISQLFYTEEKKEPVKDDTKHKPNMEIEIEVEMGHRNEDVEIQGKGDEEEMEAAMDIYMEEKMEIENEIFEDQDMETDVPLPKPEDMLDTTILIRSCVQNAIGLLRDDENVESRSTRRIEILISLLSTEDEIRSAFLKMLKCRLHKLLKTQEENIFLPEHWVAREAANQDALQEAGTFRQTLWKRVQAAVTPLLSQILSVVDRNANLDLLVDQQVEGYVKCLWMHIFHDENLLLISSSLSSQTETVLVKNYMNISVFGENRLPFSWRIKDYLEDIWTQAQHIDATGSAMRFLEIFCKTPFGQYVNSQEQNAQYNIFLNYKRDFILMTMSLSSGEELKIIEFALSACIEELRSSTKVKEPLLLPWVHIGYSTFQHRLQNLNRILVVNPSVVNFLLEKIADPKPILRNEMVLDLYAAIACLESLKRTMRSSDSKEWMQQVKNIQVPIELTCSEGYLQGQDSWCEIGINQIRKLWNCVYSMALFMEHLLVEENIQDENMQGLIRGNTWFLGGRLENFTDIKTARPFMAVVDALHKCRNEVAESVSRFGMQLCTVCRGDPNEPVCLECGHVFCRSCLKQWLDTANRTCPLCKQLLPENFIMVVSKEISDCIQKNIEFRKQCNGFFVDIICNLCFKDNSPPDDEVIQLLLSFLFNNTDIGSVSFTRSLSPFEDAVDKTPVIRSVILKLLLKYSFDIIMKHAQEYLNRVKMSNLLKLADTKEVYVLFINCLEDSLYERKQKLQNENEKLEYLEVEALFLQNYLRSSKQQKKEDTSVQLLQDVARVRLALDVAAEVMSVKTRGDINVIYMRCVKDLCSQSGNDWYRVYLIRKLANLHGMDTVQRHFKDPAFGWLFPRGMLQNKDTETNHMDHFLVCGESYKVLREGISRAMMEGKEEKIATAIEECKSQDQELAVHILLAVFREITLYYGVRNSGHQGTAHTEQEAVMDLIKNAQIFKDRSLNQFLETLLRNNRPFLRAVPGMRGSNTTIFGFAVHLASILLSGNNHILVPLKNLSFSSARMQNSFLPTMPEDMLFNARSAVGELQWYVCLNGHYCAIGECGQPMETSRCLDCGAKVGGQNHAPVPGFQRIQPDVDRTQTGHVLGDPDRQGPAVAQDRDLAPPAFILLRMITHLAMLLGSEDNQSLMHIVKPPVQDVTNFIFRHIERDLEYLKNSLGKSTDDTTTVVHLVLDKMLNPQQSGQWPVNFDDVWSTKQMRNSWEKHFASMVITPVLRNLDRDLMTVNNYIREDERISSNPVVKVVYGDPVITGEKMDLPKDSNVYCSKIWSCRERISIEYILHAVQQKDGKDTLPLLWKFLEKETELQKVKFLPNILKLQKDLVKKFQNYRDISYKTIEEFIKSINSAGARYIFNERIQEFMLAWNHLRLSLQTNGEIKLPEGMCDQILTMDSEFEFLLPRRQGLGLCATALTSYLIALHNSFIYALAKYTNVEQKFSIKASEVLELHVISYELEKDLVPIILSNCQYSLESGKETLQEFDFAKIQHQLTTRLFQGKPLITMVGLPTLTLSHDRNYKNLFTDVKKRLPQDSLSNSAIDVISKDLNAFSDVCEALNIVDISLGFLATSGENPELSLTEYVEDILQMGEQSSAHVLEALKRCHLKNTIALWQLLTALKSQHLLHLKRDPFENVDKVYKQKLCEEGKHALNVFLEQNGTNIFLLELHEMIVLKLRNPQSADDFPPSWILRDVMVPFLDDNGVSFPELENDFPEQIALAHCIEAWKVAAAKKWNRI